MRLMFVRFPYSRRFTAAEVASLQPVFILGPQEFKEVLFDNEVMYEGNWWADCLVDLDLMPATLMEGIEIRRTLSHPSIVDLQERVQTVVNQKVKVATSNGALMQIREVKVGVDLCTDALQKELNEGWLILAICVQPDQRRPDYILGRPQ